MGAGQKAAEQRRESMATFGGPAVLVLAVVVVTACSTRSSSEPESTAQNVALESVSGLGSASAPPWRLPANAPARVKAAGLNLGPMGMADHYHAHLEVIIDGDPVPVPEGIGIDPRNGAMSAVHTHSSDGIVHIEATRKGQPFTVGQLFTQWDVRLTADQIGSARAGDDARLKAYVNGKEVSGDPAMIRLAERQQIALVFRPGDSPIKPPADFEFPDDL